MKMFQTENQDKQQYKQLYINVVKMCFLAELKMNYIEYSNNKMTQPEHLTFYLTFLGR